MKVKDMSDSDLQSHVAKLQAEQERRRKETEAQAVRLRRERNEAFLQALTPAIINVSH